MPKKTADSLENKKTNKNKKNKISTNIHFQYISKICIKIKHHLTIAWFKRIKPLSELFVLALFIFVPTNLVLSGTFRSLYVASIDNSYKVLLRLTVLVVIYATLFFKLRSGRSLKNPKGYISDSNREDVSSPATNRDQLKKRIYGPLKSIDKTQMKTLDKVIDDQIRPIIKFIGDNHRVFSINGSWGSGKTTRLNIAIDEAILNNSDFKIYYESAYKYVIPGISEYARDLYSNIQAFMQDNGAGYDVINDLILDQTSKGLISKFIQQDFNASESINRANKQFSKIKSKKKLLIVIDDIDRLSNPDQIYQLFSVISIIRRLYFVKLILIFDRTKINQILKSSDSDNYDSRFIGKYVPELNSITIKTDYSYMETEALNIAARFYRDSIKSNNDDKTNKVVDKMTVGGTTFCGVWAIELLKGIDSYIKDKVPVNEQSGVINKILSIGTHGSFAGDNFLSSLRLSLHDKQTKNLNTYEDGEWKVVKINTDTLTRNIVNLIKSKKYESFIKAYKHILESSNPGTSNSSLVYQHIESFIYNFAEQNWDALKEYITYRGLYDSIGGGHYQPPIGKVQDRFIMMISAISDMQENTP